MDKSHSWRVIVAGGAALGGLLFGAHLLQAQAGPNAGGGAGRVAVIDVVKVFNDYVLQRDLSNELKDAQTRLEAEAKTRQQRIDGLNATVTALDPSDPTYKERVQEMLRMQIDNKVWYDTMQATVTRELSVWSNNIYADIASIVGETARERGFDVVLYKEEFEAGADPEAIKERIRRRKVVWSSGNVDLSNDVLAKLNQRYSAQPKTKKLQIP